MTTQSTNIRLHGLLLALGMLFISATRADIDTPLPGTVTLQTSYPFDVLATRVEQAVSNHKMGLVAQASASRGAASRGVSIPGNLVLMVFRNDYAVRMLNASVAAGFEAPLRLYLTENGDGTSNLTYRLPSAIFAPYGNRDLDAMATELDEIFNAIVGDATRR
ncbi:DUF302 domain-containing protein [Sedimenticola hydrogenitrophicus]|uniref:DUF302 domain-containing protein n=1 Tax=Sedimenticola hydrogenitrophicus TaxID=2967975 RepID=UPI0021A62F31|nr:DUF302 domain-containing protein [Sedimenticola hydrogenitrophicus]